MFTTGKIDWETHLAWLERTVARDDTHAFIFEQDGIPLGYVRLDGARAARMSWGFYIGEPQAPAGSGSRMLFLALDEAFGPLGAIAIDASVRPENRVSLHLHEKLGFRRQVEEAKPAGGGLVEGMEPAAVRFDIGRCSWHHSRAALSQTLFASQNLPWSGV